GAARRGAGPPRRHLPLIPAIRQGRPPRRAPPRRRYLAHHRLHSFAHRLELFGNCEHDLPRGVSSIVGSSTTPALPWRCPTLNRSASLLSYRPTSPAQDGSHTP